MCIMTIIGLIVAGFVDRRSVIVPKTRVPPKHWDPSGK